jgi:2,3-bisphosphoglycerate-dependent phosphoglycerate mutase
MRTGRLYLVRHGRTAGNQVRYVGWGDDPLDETGRRQVRALAAALAAEPIDVVYASPLRRAHDTARPLAESHGAPLHLRDGLKEIDYGAYQDVLKAERKLRLKRNHRVERMPDGESLRDVFDRVAVVRAEVEAEREAGRHVAVVAHFWSLRMLAGQVDGLSFDEVVDRDDYSPENGVATTRFGTGVR